MQDNSLPAIIKNKKRRLGQGHGSGRGKTAGRGTKGANARGKAHVYFEGGAVPLTKRLPFLRGKDKNKSLHKKPFVINIDSLAGFPAGSIVNIDSLIKHKFVNDEARVRGVKLLGKGSIKQAYKIQIPATKSAIEKITKAGGSVI